MKNQFLRAVTIFYIILPCFLFIYGWVKLPFAVIALVILATFTMTLLSDLFRTFPHLHVFGGIKRKQALSHDSILGIGLAFLLIVIWLAFSGAGGVGFQNADYKASNALLYDLIAQDWPLRATLDGTQVPIVYYVPYYLPSAIIGKAFGWVNANIFMFIWTLVGVAIAFAWFWNISKVGFQNGTTKRGILLAQIFCLAGGLDYIGYYILNRNGFTPIAHIEHWNIFFEYSSNTTLIYWVPQHTIASWLVIGLIVEAIYEKQNLKHLGMVVAAGIIWSPFGTLGIAPYLLLLLLVYLQPQYRKYLWNWESIVFNTLSIGVGAIYLLYLGSNQFKFPIGFIWQFSNNDTNLVLNLLAFWCLEFALLGFLTLLLIVLGTLFSRSKALSKHNHPGWILLLEQEFRVSPIQFYLFLLSMGVLGILPLFKMGIFNDFVMRSSIASLFIFWAFIAKVVADASVRVTKKFKLLYTLISIILTIGFFTSFNEIARSAMLYHFGPPASSNATTATVNESSIVLQRIGNEDSIFYRYLSR